MEKQPQTMRVFILMVAFSLLWVSPPISALVCHQKGITARNQDDSAYTHIETVQPVSPIPLATRSRNNAVIWHRHIDIAIQCTWQEGMSGDLIAQSGSNEPVLAYLHPTEEEEQYDGLSLGVSINHMPVLYEHHEARMIDTGFRMPSYRVERVCEHYDAQGCRHWREASNRDYRVPVDFVVPLDLYVRQLPGAMGDVPDAHVLLQLGGELNRPGREGVKVLLKGVSNLAPTPCHGAVNVLPTQIDMSEVRRTPKPPLLPETDRAPIDIHIAYQCRGNTTTHKLNMQGTLQLPVGSAISGQQLTLPIDWQDASLLDVITLSTRGLRFPIRQGVSLDTLAEASSVGMLVSRANTEHAWRSPSLKQAHAFRDVLVLGIQYR